MIVTHWSIEPLKFPLRNVSQGGRSPPGKPCGFWVSDESDYGWREWRRDNASDCSPHRTDFMLDASRVIHVRTESDLLAFDQIFSLITSRGKHDFDRIDWVRVANMYDGILISPYQPTQRFDLSWYYGWDCASGCIWRPECLTLISEASQPAPVLRKGSGNA